MNKLLQVLLMLLCSLIIFSCKKDESNPAGSIGFTILSNNTLTGRIENWAGGNNKAVVPIVGGVANWSLGSGQIASDGSFSLGLSFPDTSSLVSINNSLLQAGCTGINTSDPSARGGRIIEEFAVFRVDTLTIGYGSLYRASSTTYTLFCYVDRNCSITGNTSCGLIFSLYFTKGWNLLAMSASDPINVTSTKPSDSKWIFEH